MLQRSAKGRNVGGDDDDGAGGQGGEIEQGSPVQRMGWEGEGRAPANLVRSTRRLLRGARNRLPARHRKKAAGAGLFQSIPERMVSAPYCHSDNHHSANPRHPGRRAVVFDDDVLSTTADGTFSGGDPGGDSTFNPQSRKPRVAFGIRSFTQGLNLFRLVASGDSSGLARRLGHGADQARDDARRHQGRRHRDRPGRGTVEAQSSQER